MDELERYLARRRRRRRFALTIRDPARLDRWARVAFDSEVAISSINGRVIEELSLRDMRLSLTGSGLADFVDRMAGAGWTMPGLGYTDPRGGRQSYAFRRPMPHDDTAATYTAIARGAAAALLGIDRYLLTIEPYQGQTEYLSESALYGSWITMGGFVVGAAIAILVALAVGNPLEVALVAGALLAIAALYWARLYALDDGRVRLLAALSESAIVELPVVGPLIEFGTGLAAMSVGVWLPIAVAIVITTVV